MKRIIVLFLVAVMALSGCSSKAAVSEEVIDQAIKDGDTDEVVVIDTETQKSEGEKPGDTQTETGSDVVDSSKETPETETQAEAPEVKIDPAKVRINPLTGLQEDKSLFLGRPMAVMLDNYYKARPQAGLSQADIVYEMLVEGNITRYMAIFYSQGPKAIGPTRSARPYFLDKALEYNPYYIHVGGSEAAKKLIKEFKMADIDGLYSGAFYRKKHKPIPNNMYTSTAAIVKDAKRKKYTLNTEVTYYTFNEKDTDLVGGEKASSLRIPYRGEKYYSGFEYNADNKLYYRYVNSKPHIDENNDEVLTAKNVVVQYATKKVIDSVGRLDIDLIGEGKGKYFTNGSAIDITWKKASSRELTRYYDKDGNELKLNPGVTWFQIVPKDIKIMIRD